MKALIQAHFQMIESELLAVERRLQILLQSEIPIVSELGLYLTHAGGKRFRPALVLFFYNMLSEQAPPQHAHPKDEAIEQAALLEMIHMATLAHDDVIDRADQRRHHASLHLEWGNRKAVYEGDFIFSRVFKVLNRYEMPIRSLVIEAVEDVLEGELLQESLRWQVATEEEYYRVIQGKTASLIAAACALGARLGNTCLSSNRVNAIYEAGSHLGTAYQMVDDLLDIFGDDIGKPTWSDRNGGWLTLPFIWLLERSNAADELLSLLQARTITEHEREYLLAQLNEKGIHQAIVASAREQIERAKLLLQWLPDSAVKQALFSSFCYVLDRKL